jgi:hypothetical protein
MPNDPDNYDVDRQSVLVALTAYIVQVAAVCAMIYARPNYWRQPYHTSALLGRAWVQELIEGHPGRIRNELGMHLHVFLTFIYELRTVCGLADSRHVDLEEKAAIFLYMCVTGLSIRHVGERFQRSNDTISK